MAAAAENKPSAEAPVLWLGASIGALMLTVVALVSAGTLRPTRRHYAALLGWVEDFCYAQVLLGVTAIALVFLGIFHARK